MLMALPDIVKKPSSRFVKVKCRDCGGDNIVFDRPVKEVKCLLCGTVLGNVTGGKAEWRGELVEEIE